MHGRGFRVFMFLDMSLGLLRRPKRAVELTLKSSLRRADPTRQCLGPRLSSRGRCAAPNGWEPASRRRGGNLGFRV